MVSSPDSLPSNCPDPNEWKNKERLKEVDSKPNIADMARRSVEINLENQLGDKKIESAPKPEIAFLPRGVSKKENEEPFTPNKSDEKMNPVSLNTWLSIMGNTFFTK